MSIPRKSIGEISPVRVLHRKKAASIGKNMPFTIGLPQSPTRSPMSFKTNSDAADFSPEAFSAGAPSPSPTGHRKSRFIRLSRPSRTYTKVFNFNEAIDVDDAEEFKLDGPLKLEKVVSADESPHKTLGNEAVSNFYLHYKRLDKIQDINNFTQVRDATYTSILGKTQTLSLLPSKVGIIKQHGESSKIKLNHFRLGDKYAEVLSEGIKSVEELNTLELANNRLTPAGADHILSKVNNLTQYIDLAGNSIGKIGCSHLCNIIGMKSSKLLEVNLEGNKLGDICISQLCEAVAYNDSLRKLNIGKNFLSDKAADKISRMLELNISLEELYLQWNQIKSPGGALIMAGLRSAVKLKVLDFSWNSLGQYGSNFAKAFATYISSNTTLVHLDLSNNHINKQDSLLIADGLKMNHTLYGIHFNGNTGYIDCKGFLVIADDMASTSAGAITQPAINGVKPQVESLKHHTGNWGEYKDVCWICEGWRPVEISAGTTILNQDPVHAHISYEGYKEVFLPSSKGFRNIRMAPPTRFDYFFSMDGVYTHTEDQAYGKPENPYMKLKVNGEEQPVKLDYINVYRKSSQKKIIDENFEPIHELIELNLKPRIADEIYTQVEAVQQRPPWKFPVSIFRAYRVDAQALLDECFKTDFDETRITKIIKNAEDLGKVKDMLHQLYPQLKECYKYYAALGAPSEVWCMPLNAFTEFCTNCGIVDGKALKLSDLDRMFIATYTNPEKDKNHRNPDRAIVRYQFLEALVRIADQKYLNTGAAHTYTEALSHLLEENVKPHIKKFNHQEWRINSYWNEQVDVIYKSYLPILKGIYKKYSGQKAAPGQKKFMSLEEFMKCMSDSNILNEHCGERDATIAFGLSMMTQVDELHSDRIYQMQFVEFLEAFARVADKVAPLPGGSNVSNTNRSSHAENEMSYEQRFAQPLYVKLENLMPVLFALSTNDVKETWILPESSVLKMEESSPKQKFSTKKKKILNINPTLPSSIEPYDGINALQI